MPSMLSLRRLKLSTFNLPNIMIFTMGIVLIYSNAFWPWITFGPLFEDISGDQIFKFGCHNRLIYIAKKHNLQIGICT